jgi:putative flippase GtrA
MLTQIVKKITEHHVFKFAIVGVIGCVVDIAILYVGLALGLGLYVGRLLSFIAAATTTWIINRSWTFAGRQSQKNIWQEWLHYMGLMVIGGVFNYAAYAIAIYYVSLIRQYPVLGVMIGSVVGMFANFISARFVIFKHDANT